jgi:hypothetical protein
MMKVVTLIERETGRARSIVLDKYTQRDIEKIALEKLTATRQLDAIGRRLPPKGALPGAKPMTAPSVKRT